MSAVKKRESKNPKVHAVKESGEPHEKPTSSYGNADKIRPSAVSGVSAEGKIAACFQVFA